MNTNTQQKSMADKLADALRVLLDPETGRGDTDKLTNAWDSAAETMRAYDAQRKGQDAARAPVDALRFIVRELSQHVDANARNNPVSYSLQCARDTLAGHDADAPWQVWPAANGDDDPAAWRIEVGDTILAWIYSEEDAVRIVQCVNACAGVADPAKAIEAARVLIHGQADDAHQRAIDAALEAGIARGDMFKRGGDA